MHTINISNSICDESIRNFSTNLLRRLFGEYKFAFISNQLQKERLKWAGHLARMKEDRCCKKIFLAKTMGNTPWGRLPLKWIDCVKKDLKFSRSIIRKQLPKVRMPGEGQGPPRAVEPSKEKN
ncbi:hypothetical protein TNCV_4915901 [Trichonephila clavipes]|nr:hypothetical protein TNCV_4915901 [Trichonephila clavipes]